MFRTVWKKIRPYLKGWRTIAFNVLATLLPLASLTEWHDVLPKDYLPYYILGVTLGNMILRGLTTTPMGRNE